MAKQGRTQHQGTYQRGEDSRQQLISAGLTIFGKYGFEGASTRMLAETANVNLAAIPYYFGGKEGLYRAVVEHVAEQIRERQAPVAARIASRFHSDLSQEESLSLLHELLDSFATTIIGSDEAEQWARIIMREQMDPTPAFDILYSGVIKQIHGICALLIGRMLEQAEDDPNTLIRAFTIMGQILIFRAANAATLKRLGWKKFSADRVSQIQAIVRQQVDAILQQPQKDAP